MASDSPPWDADAEVATWMPLDEAERIVRDGGGDIVARMPGRRVRFVTACRSDGATPFPPPLDGTAVLRTVDVPDDDAHVLARVRATCDGALVRRHAARGVSVYVRDRGQVRHTLVPKLIALCVLEHPVLQTHYAPEGPLVRNLADDHVFPTLAHFLAHAIEHAGVDLLDDLRHRPTPCMLRAASLAGVVAPVTTPTDEAPRRAA